MTTRPAVMCFSWITQSASTRLVGPQKVHRACGLANYLLTVSRCSSWHCCLHSCPANNLDDFSLLQLQGRKKEPNVDTWCLTWVRMVWVRMVCYWVKSCLTHVLSRWVGCGKIRIVCHTDLPGCHHDWGMTVTRSLSVMTQMKHDHDTQR